MKKLPLLLVWLAFGNYPSAYAQAWCPPGATWHYGFATSNSNGYEKYTYMGDTVFNAVQYQLIAKEVHSYTQNPPGYHVIQAPDIYMRLVDDVLMGFGPRGLDTLVWFDAVPGDAWQVLQPEDSGCLCDQLVTDTGHVVLDGVSLRFLRTEVTSPFFECMSATRLFVERIGSYGSFFG